MSIKIYLSNYMKLNLWLYCGWISTIFNNISELRAYFNKISSNLFESREMTKTKKRIDKNNAKPLSLIFASIKYLLSSFFFLSSLSSNLSRPHETWAKIFPRISLYYVHIITTNTCESHVSNKLTRFSKS